MWSLYENEKLLKPLVFSNGKNQEDIVNEAVSAVREGKKVIFIKGVCGTGKSAIALNIAKELGRASIVVPVKSLQKQYEDDYTNRKYLLKKNGEKLKIKVLTGRANHQCMFLKEEVLEPAYVSSRKEKNSEISDFETALNRLIMMKNEKRMSETRDMSCNNPFLPCKIELKEKNMPRIRKYLEKNRKVNAGYFDTAGKVRRMSIAPVCPYWCPIIPADAGISIEAKCLKYRGLQGREYKIFKRKEGCGYYSQFDSYVDADVLIFNSHKYKIEVAMNRKPETDVEIIDECDEFLDSFANSKRISLNRLNFALGSLFPENDKVSRAVNRLMELSREIIDDRKTAEWIDSEAIVPLKDTGLQEILSEFLDSGIMNEVECDEENYCYHCEEAARVFSDFFDETYVSFSREEREVVARIVTTNLEKRFKELLDKSKAVIMMSGTLHSEKVLKDVFGLKDFIVIEAETKMPGSITIQRTGFELNCSYSNFKRTGMRERYLHALARSIRLAKKPLLVHVNSFADLPSRAEEENLGFGIIAREDLIASQEQDSLGTAVLDFKQGKADILFSTKCNRGADFPGETCRSIILTKYPYPNINSIFWKILRKTKPEYYNEFYLDKSRREFMQRIYRGLRSSDDHIFLMSPDTRVLDSGIEKGN